MFSESHVGQGFHLQPSGYIPDNSGMGGFGGMQTGNVRRNGGGQMDQIKKSKVFAPVTLKMVQQSQPRPDDQCEYDGDTINDIIIVGRLLKRIEEPMRTQFEINDNTCTYHVLFYHKGENQVPTALRNFQFEQFTYAKIYGNIRVFKEEKAIVGTHIKRIDKFDEVTNHFLSVFISHCIRKKGILKPRELAMDTNPAIIQPTNNTNSDQMHVDSHGGDGASTHQNNNNYNQKKSYNNNYHNNNNRYNNQNSNHHHNQNSSSNNQQSMLPSYAHDMSDSDIQKTILNLVQKLQIKSSFAQKDELRQLTKAICNDEKFENAMHKLQNDGQIVQAHDNNSFCIV